MGNRLFLLQCVRVTKAALGTSSSPPLQRQTSVTSGRQAGYTTHSLQRYRVRCSCMWAFLHALAAQCMPISVGSVCSQQALKWQAVPHMHTSQTQVTLLPPQPPNSKLHQTTSLHHSGARGDRKRLS
jgi:hypothetical protein